MINNKEIPLYGSGNNIREWIYVQDHIDGLLHLSKVGSVGESYCIGSGEEFSNIVIINTITKIYDELNCINRSKSLISFVKDRKGHDFRYAMDSSKIIKTGWSCKMSFDKSIRKTIQWYMNNKSFLN